MPESRARSPRVITALLLAVGYMVIMAAGWLADSYDYGTVSNLFYQTPFLFVGMVYAYSLIRWYRVPVRRARRLRTPAGLWMVALIILMDGAGMVYALSTGFHGHWAAIPAVLAATLVVGFAEEGMFRGFLTTSLARRTSTGKAVFISSVMFGVLHSVNVLAHASAMSVGIQVALTMFVGYSLGTVYIRSGGSIVLVAILHALYDFVAFVTNYAAPAPGNVLSAISIVNFAAWLLLGLILFISNRRQLPDLAQMQTDSAGERRSTQAPGE